MEALLIIQARIGGTRFPRKVLAHILGQPMLLWQLDRLRVLQGTARIVVAVPHGQEQHPIRDLCQRHGYACLAAPKDIAEDDVLGRYASVLSRDRDRLDTIVRITADCPLIDPVLVREMIAYHHYGKASTYQLQSCIKSPFDHTGIAAEWPDGQDVEVCRRDVLLAVENDTILDSPDREHVTPGIWRHPDRFQCATYPCTMDLSRYQCSVDTPEDLLLVSGIMEWCLERYGFQFGWREIWWCFQCNPHFRAMMEQRAPRNHAYVAQVGAATWEAARYAQ